jgi:hypothetical protein
VGLGVVLVQEQHQTKEGVVVAQERDVSLIRGLRVEFIYPTGTIVG